MRKGKIREKFRSLSVKMNILIIAIILSVVTMILNFANGVNVSTLLDGIVGIVFSVTSFACARTIRNSL